jgi:Uri superfamily endonuclease
MFDSQKQVRLALKGTYVLIIRIRHRITTAVGSLGRIKFSPGSYAYVGSAQSNLEQRISRHLGRRKKLFWHIDYLLNNNSVEIAKVFVKLDAPRTEECIMADVLKSKSQHVEHFGASGCRCRGHLFRIKDFSFLLSSMKLYYQNSEKTCDSVQ